MKAETRKSLYYYGLGLPLVWLGTTPNPAGLAITFLAAVGYILILDGVVKD